MKKLIILPTSILLMAFACQGQNGPTPVPPPSVTLTWVQSGTVGVTKNCVYRGAVAGVYTLPAIFCSATPVLTYTDTGVARGGSYHYAVTAQTGANGQIIESQYSGDVVAVVPAGVSAPSAVIVVVK